MSSSKSSRHSSRSVPSLSDLDSLASLVSSAMVDRMKQSQSNTQSIVPPLPLSSVSHSASLEPFTPQDSLFTKSGSVNLIKGNFSSLLL
jgi:hypothetical protein